MNEELLIPSFLTALQINKNNLRLIAQRKVQVLNLLGQLQRQIAPPAHVTDIPRGPYCQLKVELLLEALHDPDQLKKHFRLNEGAFHKLKTLISTNIHHGWDEEIQLLCFLFWLACGAAYRVVSAAIGVPRSTVCDIVHSVLKKVLNIIKTVIKLPTEHECLNIAHGFSQLSKTNYIDKAVGSIDGTHIKIMPRDDQREDYINHKLFYSINLQAVCDSKGVFLDIFSGYPGSVHDSRVLKCSPLYRQNAYPPPGFYIIGDSAYPCSIRPLTILTPYKQAENNPVKARFNYHLSSARTIIERAFGRMKTRWRSVFTKTLEISPVIAPDVAAACAIMHNICIMAGDEWGEEVEEIAEADLPIDDQPAVPRQESGEPLRARIAAQISAPLDQPQYLREHDYF